MTSVKKTDRPLLQNVVKSTSTTVASGTKMLVIRKMEAGEKRAVCSFLNLPPATVPTIMANGEKKGTENHKIAGIRCKLQ
jgi:hypothetical protein